MDMKVRAKGNIISIEERNVQKKDGSGNIVFRTALLLGEATLLEFSVSDALAESVRQAADAGVAVEVDLTVGAYRDNAQMRALSIAPASAGK